MKKVLVVALLVLGVAAVAFAALTTTADSKNKSKVEKKAEKKEKKKECKRTCWLS